MASLQLKGKSKGPRNESEIRPKHINTVLTPRSACHNGRHATLRSRQEAHMSHPISSHEAWLSTLEDHLHKERYASKTARHCVAVAREFLAFLDRQQISLSAVQPATVDLYLDIALRDYRRLHGHPPQYEGWRRTHTDGIHMLLRLVQGHWPPICIPVTPSDLFKRE